MAYSVNTDVDRALGPYATSDTTAVTTNGLTHVISEIDQQVDGILQGAGIASVPVVVGDDSIFFAYLNSVSIWGSTAVALRMLFPDSNLDEFFQKKYEDALATLRSKEDIPSGLLGGANDPTAATYFTKNTAEEATLGALEGAHLFTVDDIGDKPW